MSAGRGIGMGTGDDVRERRRGRIVTAGAHVHLEIRNPRSGIDGHDAPNHHPSHATETDLEVPSRHANIENTDDDAAARGIDAGMKATPSAHGESAI